MSGPAPKPANLRQRTNRTTTSAKLQATPAVKVPLPERDWHPMVTSWWDTIWASPMVAEWVAADVPDLIGIAVLWDEFWRAGGGDAPKIHAEIRTASREFGLTPLARRSLQWEIIRVENAKPVATPSPAAPKRRTDPRLRLISSGG